MSRPASFLNQFFRLAIANILSNLMVPLAGLMDVAFLGHLEELHHLAGVALATVLVNYIYWTFCFLRMGTTGTTAQAVGRNDPEAVLLIGLRHGAIALGLGLLVVLLQHPLQILGFSLLSAEPEVEAAGQSYYNALIWGAPATLLNYVLIGWFLGRGQSGKVLLLSLVGNGTKVLLDYLLVVLWNWQSVGAGVATASSQYLMLLTGLLLLSREFHWQRIWQLRQKLCDRQALKACFMLNSEILVRSFAMVSTFGLFTNLSSTLGTTTLTTNAVLLQVVTLAAYFIDGLAYATESLAGIFQGRGTTTNLATLVKVAGATSLSLGLGFAIGFNLAPSTLFQMLTSHGSIVEQLSQYVVWLLPVLGFGSIAYMLDGYFLGLTEGRILRNAAITAAICGFSPLAIAAWYFQNNHLLWSAMALFMLFRVVALGLKVPQTIKPLDTKTPPLQGLEATQY